LNVPPSSRALVRRVRSLSAAILSPASPRPSSRPTSAPDHSRKSRRRCGYAWQARRPSRSLEHAFACCVRSRGRRRTASPCGSLRRLPNRAHVADSYNLAAARRPAGSTHPALPASRICQPCFRLDRPWAPSLQRLLPARRRKTLSGLAVLHAVSHLAVPRLRGIQRHAPPASRPMSRVEPPSPRGADCSLGRTRSLRRRCSRRHKAAPLLVVSPLRG
jgi:hypothetical protein